MIVRELLPIYFERSAAVQTFWNFHITVSLGMLAFVSAAHTAINNVPIALIFTFAFIAFTLSNLGVLMEVQRQRYVLSEVIKQLVEISEDEHDRNLADLATPPELWKVQTFHLVMDAFVIIVIWFVPWVLEKTTSTC